MVWHKANQEIKFKVKGKKIEIKQSSHIIHTKVQFCEKNEKKMYEASTKQGD